MLGGKFNLGSLLKNAKKIEEIMQRTQIQGEAGAGMVKLTITAQYEVLHLDLSDELLKEPKEIIQDVIKAAFNDASRKVQKIIQEKMASAGNFFNSGNQED